MSEWGEAAIEANHHVSAESFQAAQPRSLVSGNRERFLDKHSLPRLLRLDHQFGVLSCAVPVMTALTEVLPVSFRGNPLRTNPFLSTMSCA
jgi:hypothetical protein